MTLLILLFLPAAAYQLLAITASWRQAMRRPPEGNSFQPPVSILKPMHGTDPDMYRAIVSQAEQNYPTFEILFGVSRPDDSAAPIVKQLQREHPEIPIKLIVGACRGANAKVAVLSSLARSASYPIWLINDSDIEVTPNYLSQVVAPLADPAVGLVTCLYRPKSYSRPSAWEAFGVAIDFMPSTLVAPLVGVREFGLGSTLCFRAADFIEAGGFASIADFLADDYQLARQLVRTGKRAYLSTYVVDTSLGDCTWEGVWQHQLRWARTIRASKGAGFAGLPITHTGVWILVACLLNAWPAALILTLLRITAALLSGWLVLRLPRTKLWALLAPVWDLWAFAIWAASYASREIRWRDRRFRVAEDGRLESI